MVKQPGKLYSGSTVVNGGGPLVKTGIMEEWNYGLMAFKPNTLIFQYSNIPILQHPVGSED
jgi:hypothetical protein